MKNMLLFSFLFCAGLSLNAQDANLLEFNQTRLKKTKTAMTILGGWSVVNIGSGLVLQANASGENKYFHQMNAAWNGVNLLIAGMGYLGVNKKDSSSFNLAQTVKEQQKIQKILIFNAGLDLAYITAGFYLREVAKSKDSVKDQHRLKGWGKSIALQGGFLFLFDATTAFLLSRDNPKLDKFLSAVYFDGNQLGLSWQF